MSPYTVSAVVNGSRSNTLVSEATRRRIMESAAKVDYHPNAVARSLASRKTFSIGVLFGVLNPTAAIGNAYAIALLQGIMDEAAAHRYNILLFTQEWEDAVRSAPGFRDRRTDGVILVAPLTDTDMLAALSALPIPLVAISPDPALCPAHVPSVDVDNAAGIRQAVRHLADLGHTRIAHITGNPNVASVDQRRKAFILSLAERGLPPALPGHIVPASYDAKTVPDLVPRLLDSGTRPTAIVAGNDNIAAAVIMVCRSLGVSVPGQLSVIGFDGLLSESEVTPALSTIRQPIREIGAEAVRLLLAEIESSKESDVVGGRVHHPIYLAPELVLRGSVGRVATNN